MRNLNFTKVIPFNVKLTTYYKAILVQMPLKHSRRKRYGTNACSFFSTTIVPLLSRCEHAHATRHCQCALHDFFCRNWNLPLKFTEIKFQNNLFIKSRDFWVSRRSWSLLGRYTSGVSQRSTIMTPSRLSHPDDEHTMICQSVGI